MPFVSVKIVDDGVTLEQKKQVIKEITDTLSTVLGKDPADTMVLIEKHTADDWGLMGKTIREIRAEKK